MRALLGVLAVASLAAAGFVDDAISAQLLSTGSALGGAHGAQHGSPGADFSAHDALAMMAGTGANSGGFGANIHDQIGDAMGHGNMPGGSGPSIADQLGAAMGAGDMPSGGGGAVPADIAAMLAASGDMGAPADAPAAPATPSDADVIASMINSGNPSAHAPMGGGTDTDLMLHQLGGGDEAGLTLGHLGSMGGGELGGLGMGLGDAFGAADAGGASKAFQHKCMGGYVTDLEVYAGCEVILGFLAVVHSDLTNVDKLEKLTSIDWDVNTQGPGGNGLIVANNTMLHNLKGFAALKQVTGGVLIENNAQLTSATGVGEGLLHIGINDAGESVVIRGNDKLADIGSSWDVWQGSLPGALVIESNAILSQINGFGSVFTIGGGLDIGSNAMLRNLDAFSSLKAVTGKNRDGSAVHIVNNANLDSISGLRDLQGTLEGALDISGNPHLKSLDGLQQVLAVGKDVHGVSINIEGNAALQDTTGISGLRGSMPGAIRVLRNPNLHVLAGLQRVSEFGADRSGDSIVVEANHVLQSLLGFSGVTSVGGAVEVNDNPALASLEGLQNVRSVGGKNSRGHALEVMVKGLEITTLSELQAHVSSLTPAGVSTDANTTAVGAGPSHICGGASRSTWDAWQAAGSTGLSIDVDTSSCAFVDDHPRYMSSIVGDSAHWQLTGVNSIFSSNAAGFRVYLWHPVLRGKFMQFFAKRYRWQLSWLADAGQTSGMTKAGASGWKKVPKTTNALYIDVDTTASAYSNTPRYVTSIHGGKNHWKVQGVHSVYEPRATGFRLFVVYPDPIEPQFAEHNRWQIAWVGSEDDVTSGSSSTAWSTYKPAGRSETSARAITINVDTSNGMYAHTPSYVTSITGHAHHWMVTGAASIYDATPSSFRIYLDNAKATDFVAQFDWRVNYIAAADPMPCLRSPWGSWSACTHRCNGGTQTRSRSVVRRAYYGGTCTELAQTRICNKAACAFDCKMSDWTPPSACDATCGSGRRQRTRVIIVHPTQGGRPCGATVRHEPCDAGPCPLQCQTAPWSSWSECSLTCGSGRQKRTRFITRHATGHFQCPSLDEARSCATQPCPVDCKISQWSAWALCDKSCGWGTMQRTRSPIKSPRHGGKACPAILTRKPCHAGYCPVKCIVAAWGRWSSCSRSCGRGTQTRVRAVLRHAKHGGFVCPTLRETEECNVDPCPIDCAVSTWSDWGACDRSCGTGQQLMHRRITRQEQNGGAACPQLLLRRRACNAHPCPSDCSLADWGQWSECDRSCGAGGTKHRWRAFNYNATFGGKPCGHTFERVPCNIPCPRNCVTSIWSNWQECSKSCGAGTSRRTRKVTKTPAHGGYTCPSLEETRGCNLGNCPLDCVQSAWSTWTACPASCGWKHQMRNRTVLQSAEVQGKPCGANLEVRACGKLECPLDCIVGHWGSWGACSDTCGTQGTATRKRFIYRDALHGGVACPQLTQTQRCDAGPCPVHCAVSPWGAWGKCKRQGVVVTCGGGIKWRTRSIVAHASNGGMVCPVTDESDSCASNECKIDCMVGSWGSWSTCSRSCGTGSRLRVRAILTWASGGGKKCPSVQEAQMCNTVPCPSNCRMAAWGSWQACSTSCGIGVQWRNRAPVRKAKWGGRACPARQQKQPCFIRHCPVHCTVGDWSSWSACTKTCGGGRHTRFRDRKQEALHGGNCPSLKEEADCKTQACPVDCTVGSWGTWAPYKGGGGRLRRSRLTVQPALHGGKPCPPLAETRQWKQSHSSKDVPHGKTATVPACHGGTFYGKWSSCTRTCGSGYRYRYREQIACSGQAVVKYHLKFRQGERCSVLDCVGGADPGAHAQVTIPPVELPNGMKSLIGPAGRISTLPDGGSATFSDGDKGYWW